MQPFKLQTQMLSCGQSETGETSRRIAHKTAAVVPVSVMLKLLMRCVASENGAFQRTVSS
jgi:hypothetical protein